MTSMAASLTRKEVSEVTAGRLIDRLWDGDLE
jgi:hypothetical protein